MLTFICDYNYIPLLVISLNVIIHDYIPKTALYMRAIFPTLNQSIPGAGFPTTSTQQNAFSPMSATKCNGVDSENVGNIGLVPLGVRAVALL